MMAFMALLILICTLSLSSEGLKGGKDEANPATVESHHATIVDRMHVCRNLDGEVVQRDLSSSAAPSAPAADATPTQP